MQQKPRDVPLIHVVFIAMLACSLYIPSINFAFVYDDFLQIVLNPQVTSASKSSLVDLLLMPTPPGNLYRPLTTATYTLTHAYVGLAPGVFHAINVLLYAATSIVTLIALSQILPTARSACIGAILFTVHPLHTEVVANVIGRAELLAAFFVLLSFICVRKSVLTERAFSITAYATLGAGCFLCATLSKESSLSLIMPILFGAWLCLGTTQPWQLRTLRIIPALSSLTAISVLTLFLRASALGSNFIIHPDGKTWIENPIFNEPFLARAISSFAILGEYLRLLALPIHQSADYSCTPQVFYAWLMSPNGILSLLTPLILVILFIRYHNSRLCIVWILAGFLLTINLVTPIGTLMGERLTFTPSIGMAGLLGLFVDTMIIRLSKFGSSLSLLYCATLIWLTVMRIPIWASNEALFSATTIDAPNSPKAWYNLGVQEVLHTPTSSIAESHFRRAIELYPDYMLPTRALADIMLARGDLGRLEYWYRAILNLDPDDSVVQANLDTLKQHSVKSK